MCYYDWIFSLRIEIRYLTELMGKEMNFDNFFACFNMATTWKSWNNFEFWNMCTRIWISGCLHVYTFNIITSLDKSFALLFKSSIKISLATPDLKLYMVVIWFKRFPQKCLHAKLLNSNFFCSWMKYANIKITWYMRSSFTSKKWS